MKAWDERPRPAGLAPCPELGLLRELDQATALPARRSGPEVDAFVAALDARRRGGHLRVLHHAPGELVVPSLLPGTQLELEGVGARGLSFRIPEAAVRIGASTTHLEDEVYVVRSAHVDVDAGTLSVVFAHTFRYAPSTAPAWIRIRSAPAGPVASASEVTSCPS